MARAIWISSPTPRRSLGWLDDTLDQPGRHARLRPALETLTAGPLARLVERADADWLVCSHFLRAAVASELKARAGGGDPADVVVTDFDAHALWLAPHVDRYFVALDETRRDLAALGVPVERITVSGIPHRLLADPERLGAMRANARRLARPRAASEITKSLVAH
jgi:processive 1,2-diacylglycerol beta-glucosyltransferase